MSDGSWGDLSQQAIGAAGVVYFLALIAHLVEWSSFVGSRKQRAAVRVGAEAPASRQAGPPTYPLSTAAPSTGSPCSAGSACF